MLNCKRLYKSNQGIYFLNRHILIRCFLVEKSIGSTDKEVTLRDKQAYRVWRVLYRITLFGTLDGRLSRLEEKGASKGWAVRPIKSGTASWV